MATVLSFLSGRQITNSNGVPQAGALLYHYQAGTTSNLTVYSNQAGTTPHAQPVVCDAGGFVPLIYVGDAVDWKVVIQTAAAVTLQTYDNLPAAVAEQSAAGFTPPLLSWVQVTSTPQALTAANAGNAYEANTTSNSIEFDLPSAASVGNGKGFFFKKTSASNSMILDPSGSETIDDVSTSLTVTAKDTVIGIFSNGAEWYTIVGLVTNDMLRSTFVNGLTAATTAATTDEFLLQLASGGAFRKIAASAMPGTITTGTVVASTSGTSIDFTGLPASIKRITLMFDQVDLSGTDSIIVQLGDSGGLETTGYVSSSFNRSAAASDSNGFLVFRNTESVNGMSGHMTITRITSNTWVQSHAMGETSGSAVSCAGGGVKSLSAELDRLSITRTGSNTFNGGQINIMYELF